MLRSLSRQPSRPAEPLAVLLLPDRLESFERADHARDLLAIARVVAIEPGRSRRRAFAGEVMAARQARRLRFPGTPRVVVLYDPRQYHLAGALSARYGAELWYLPPERLDEAEAVQVPDQLARARAVQVLSETEAAPLRARLRELEIISHRPFVPGASVDAR